MNDLEKHSLDSLEQPQKPEFDLHLGVKQGPDSLLQAAQEFVFVEH